MRFLRTKNLIQPTKPKHYDTHLPEPYWQVQFEIFAELNGMLLEFYAKYEMKRGASIVNKEQVSIAAGFAPGCK